MSFNEHKLPSLQGRKVLVTGGMGFIGSNLAQRCVQLGAEVAVLDNLDHLSAGNEHNLDDLRPAVKVFRGDVRKAADLDRAVDGCDLVFHCAARTSHAQSQTMPVEYDEVNCQGTLRLLEAMRSRGARARLVNVGTTTQVGRMTHCPIDETHPEFPTDVYSATKVAAEKYVLLFGRQTALQTVSVRLPNIYGPRACVRSANFGFINYFIGLALQGKPMTIYGDGGQKRNFCYVDDAVAGLILAATSEKAVGETFLAVADEHLSVARMSRLVAEVIGGSVTFVPWDPARRKIEVGDAVFTNQKIRSLLGWQPKADPAAALAQTQAFYRPRLDLYLQ